jgi:hypothetical protein
LKQLKAALKPIITRLDGIDTKLKEIDRKLVLMNVRINNAPQLAYNMSATPTDKLRKQVNKEGVLPGDGFHYPNNKKQLANNNEISNADVNALITFYELKNLPNGSNQRRMLLTSFLGAEI